MSRTDGLRVLVVSTLSEHRDAWDALVELQPIPSPFLRSWWLEAVSGPRAQHLLILDSETLVGGLPLSRRRLPGLTLYRFAGQGPLCPDHLDAIALPARAEDVVECLRAWWQRPGQRLALMAGLVEDSLLARAWPGQVTAVDVAPYGELPETGEAYLRALSGNFRHNIKRSQRRVDEAGVHTWVAAPSTLGRAMEHFGALQASREGRGHLVAALPVLSRAVAAGVATGEARVDVMETRDGDPVAVCITFLTRQRLSLYQVARTLEHEYRGAGTAQVASTVCRGIELGCREFDLLRGPESYKANFVGRSRDVLTLDATHGVRAQGLLRARELGKRTKRSLERVAARRRPVPQD